LALFKKSGGFKKYWRLTETGGFTKYRHPAEKQADDRILAHVKIPAPGEKPAVLENTGGPLTV
jgi:hypothetical protein